MLFSLPSAIEVTVKEKEERIQYLLGQVKKMQEMHIQEKKELEDVISQMVELGSKVQQQYEKVILEKQVVEEENKHLKYQINEYENQIHLLMNALKQSSKRQEEISKTADEVMMSNTLIDERTKALTLSPERKDKEKSSHSRSTSGNVFSEADAMNEFLADLHSDEQRPSKLSKRKGQNQSQIVNQSENGNRFKMTLSPSSAFSPSSTFSAHSPRLTPRSRRSWSISSSGPRSPAGGLSRSGQRTPTSFAEDRQARLSQSFASKTSLNSTISSTTSSRQPSIINSSFDPHYFMKHTRQPVPSSPSSFSRSQRRLTRSSLQLSPSSRKQNLNSFSTESRKSYANVPTPSTNRSATAPRTSISIDASRSFGHPSEQSATPLSARYASTPQSPLFTPQGPQTPASPRNSFSSSSFSPSSTQAPISTSVSGSTSFPRSSGLSASTQIAQSSVSQNQPNYALSFAAASASVPSSSVFSSSSPSSSSSYAVASSSSSSGTSGSPISASTSIQLRSLQPTVTPLQKIASTKSPESSEREILRAISSLSAHSSVFSNNLVQSSLIRSSVSGSASSSASDGSSIIPKRITKKALGQMESALDALLSEAQCSSFDAHSISGMGGLPMLINCASAPFVGLRAKALRLLRWMIGDASAADEMRMAGILGMLVECVAAAADECAEEAEAVMAQNGAGQNGAERGQSAYDDDEEDGDGETSRTRLRRLVVLVDDYEEEDGDDGNENDDENGMISSRTKQDNLRDNEQEDNDSDMFHASSSESSPSIQSQTLQPFYSITPTATGADSSQSLFSKQLNSYQQLPQMGENATLNASDGNSTEDPSLSAQQNTRNASSFSSTHSNRGLSVEIPSFSPSSTAPTSPSHSVSNVSSAPRYPLSSPYPSTSPMNSASAPAGVSASSLTDPSPSSSSFGDSAQNASFAKERRSSSIIAAPATSAFLFTTLAGAAPSTPTTVEGGTLSCTVEPPPEPLNKTQLKFAVPKKKKKGDKKKNGKGKKDGGYWNNDGDMDGNEDANEKAGEEDDENEDAEEADEEEESEEEDPEIIAIPEKTDASSEADIKKQKMLEEYRLVGGFVPDEELDPAAIESLLDALYLIRLFMTLYSSSSNCPSSASNQVEAVPATPSASTPPLTARSTSSIRSSASIQTPRSMRSTQILQFFIEEELLSYLLTLLAYHQSPVVRTAVAQTIRPFCFSIIGKAELAELDGLLLLLSHTAYYAPLVANISPQPSQLMLSVSSLLTEEIRCISVLAVDAEIRLQIHSQNVLKYLLNLASSLFLPAVRAVLSCLSNLSVTPVLKTEIVANGGLSILSTILSIQNNGEITKLSLSPNEKGRASSGASNPQPNRDLKSNSSTTMQHQKSQQKGLSESFPFLRSYDFEVLKSAVRLCGNLCLDSNIRDEMNNKGFASLLAPHITPSDAAFTTSLLRCLENLCSSPESVAVFNEKPQLMKLLCDCLGIEIRKTGDGDDRNKQAGRKSATVLTPRTPTASSFSAVRSSDQSTSSRSSNANATSSSSSSSSTVYVCLPPSSAPLRPSALSFLSLLATHPLSSLSVAVPYCCPIILHDSEQAPVALVVLRGAIAAKAIGKYVKMAYRTLSSALSDLKLCSSAVSAMKDASEYLSSFSTLVASNTRSLIQVADEHPALALETLAFAAQASRDARTESVLMVALRHLSDTDPGVLYASTHCISAVLLSRSMCESHLEIIQQLLSLLDAPSVPVRINALGAIDAIVKHTKDLRSIQPEQIRSILSSHSSDQHEKIRSLVASILSSLHF
ncbi:uncharacterized protein MONOS_282 [Monocercomonoides exilis]|uniref:uncharacterized protein n=1 Tax=Monocercomonoides exilis TaxID=2049356 RepID=UPI00355AB8B8|nr:hypothetical protein MONOS_282 [Monocercomonoides exilis]|eukprot:MONOS_282.1-p1 / transcript=MONOS_282.1 / gene=MONOS_282 / organism=Monocercomonoides_exilis_PA203 / gene_product=unspecified product / transcript_product=unspecified product / location=Mono_scaffold00004:298483-304332(-) / protein_length=1775 / sequence_SO=supercontig / SO=protein_coding / is_pseudo=false